MQVTEVCPSTQVGVASRGSLLLQVQKVAMNAYRWRGHKRSCPRRRIKAAIIGPKLVLKILIKTIESIYQ
jgi:hypothetical protein